MNITEQYKGQKPTLRRTASVAFLASDYGYVYSSHVDILGSILSEVLSPINASFFKVLHKRCGRWETNTKDRKTAKQLADWIMPFTYDRMRVRIYVYKKKAYIFMRYSYSDDRHNHSYRYLFMLEPCRIDLTFAC